MNTPTFLVPPSIIRNFNRAAKHYDSCAMVQREIADRLLERLAMIQIEPQTIVDLGARTGYCSRQLSVLYPQADIIAWDRSMAMLQQAKQQSQAKYRVVCSDDQRLPFADHSVDLMVSNLLLHWLPFDDVIYQEIQRVLRPQGLILFSTLGPDTLGELRASWQAVDDKPHVHDFIDMHHIGDKLLQCRFVDPVMDREQLTITYDSGYQLMHDLQQLGVSNVHPQRRRTLTAKSRIQQMLAHYESFCHADGSWPATYEVIYGQAWGADIRQVHGLNSEQQEVHIPISSIQRQRK